MTRLGVQTNQVIRYSISSKVILSGTAVNLSAKVLMLLVTTVFTVTACRLWYSGIGVSLGGHHRC